MSGVEGVTRRRRMSLRGGVLAIGVIPAVGVVGGAIHAREHCMDYEEDGCPDPTGKYTCLVEPNLNEGWAYWPYQEPPGGSACVADCPNAMCHMDLGQAPKVQDRVANLLSKVDVAITAQDARTLARLVRTEPELTFEASRQAVQFVSACSKDLVVAHFSLEPAYFAQVDSEYFRPFARALTMLSWIKGAPNLVAGMITTS